MTIRNSRRILPSICLGLLLLSVTVVITETRAAAGRNLALASVLVGNNKAELLTLRGLPRSSQQTQSAEKTVEQTHKNIQVLKGLPDSQLIPVMNFFATSLGVKCNYCHVNKDGVWAYDSDEKPEKKTAREMITMVLGINKTNFRGNTDVSCFTCHRGSHQPTAIQFPLPEVAPRPEGPAAAAGQPKEAMPTADQVLDKYTAALGDTATIEKITSRVMKGNWLAPNGATVGYEVYQVAPSRIYAVLNTPRQGVIERGYNGTVGWEKRQNGIREIEGEQLAYLLRYPGMVTGGAKLKTMFTRVGFGGKDKIDGRDVFVLRATTADNKRERLFFDAQTGLLVRRVLSTPTMIGVIPQQVDYDDYRDVDGVKMPFTIKISALDQNYTATLKFTEIKLNVPVDDAKFNKPAPPSGSTQSKP